MRNKYARFYLGLAVTTMIASPALGAGDVTMPPGSAHAPDHPVDVRANVAATPDPGLASLPAAEPVKSPPLPRIPVPQVRPPEGLDQPAVATEQNGDPVATEQEVADVWHRIREGFGMPDLDGALVEKHEDWYADRPDYVARMLDRSRKYLFFIVAEIEKRGMPTEIALLPMIESAFNPRAHSTMKAAGMWQFIPSTGKRYGLKQNFWYDGRRDVMAATRAALSYLQTLHGMFGDWQLALAAYNWGEGAVARAIAKNRAAGKPTDYLSLNMPAETRNYLPKLQAVKNLISEPEAFGFSIESIPNQPYFTAVKMPGQMDVKVAAKLANMSIDEFRYLNPGHSRPVIVPVANKQLLVPADKADLFHENLENFEQPLVTWQSYRVQRKERLRHVAGKFGMSIPQLCEANGLTLKSRLRPGQLLLVPARHPSRQTALLADADHSDFAPAKEGPAHRRPAASVYRVKRGETLFSIAKRNDVSIAQLKTWNRLKSNAVHAGQKLVIRAAKSTGARAQKVASLR